MSTMLLLLLTNTPRLQPTELLGETRADRQIHHTLGHRPGVLQAVRLKTERQHTHVAEQDGLLPWTHSDVIQGR